LKRWGSSPMRGGKKKAGKGRTKKSSKKESIQTRGNKPWGEKGENLTLEGPTHKVWYPQVQEKQKTNRSN